MANEKVLRFIYAACLVLLIATHAEVALASMSDGLIIDKYAWSDFDGFVNFAASGSNVHITDAALTGYAWSKNGGWINLAPAGSGVHNDAQGNLSGYAWGSAEGFINFSGVSIDSNGLFHGLATGPVINGITYGINFDCSTCKVTTDWRQASVRTAPSSPPAPSTLTDAGGGGVLTSALSVGAQSSLSCMYDPSVPVSADINNDGTVGIFDFNQLMVHWGEVGQEPADINHDCVVGLFDFNQLMVAWTIT